ncbi:MAG: hypothetical protein A2W03_07150 [Candidatus Aminicenantes bacterium RBG_16_63_16]|nr:MAG: hypothetical protein A2W03_07150 [Candidatus Aminicenantes bacterium RBG_16_63_16]
MKTCAGWRDFLEAAKEKGTVITSIKIALVVGTILALINYGDRIFLSKDMRVLDWLKLALTYCIPFCVATYGAARYACRRRG